jgi:tetratricopeptide (TPR) repeat protein
VNTTWLAMLIGVAAASVAIIMMWRLRNEFGFRKRANSQIEKSRSRSVDSRILSLHEAKMADKAKQLAKRKQYRQASQIYESLGLQRDAISSLEDGGYIDDAASILLKMQRPNRAAVVYARHGKWGKAHEYFVKAGMSFEAARCKREEGKFEDAAREFELLNKHDESAQCHILAKDWRSAARAFVKANATSKAHDAYTRFFNQVSEEMIPNDFDTAELTLMKDHIVQNDIKTGYVRVLARSGALVELILELLQKGLVKKSVEIANLARVDVGPSLMSQVNLQSAQGRHLAEMFQHMSHFKYAGMTYEQISDFRMAAICYEEAEEHERAGYCYERAGDNVNAKRLRSTQKPNKRSKSAQSSEENPDATQLLSIAPQPAQSSVSKAVGIFSLEDVSRAETIPVDEDRAVYINCNMFEDLSFDQKNMIWGVSELKNFDDRTTIVDLLDNPIGLYFVVSGVVECVILDEQTKSDRILELFEAGSYFGELWLLVEQPSNVRFVCRTPVKAYVLDRDKFGDILNLDGSMARKVYKRFTQRLLKKMLNPSESQDIRQAS